MCCEKRRITGRYEGNINKGMKERKKERKKRVTSFTVIRTVIGAPRDTIYLEGAAGGGGGGGGAKIKDGSPFLQPPTASSLPLLPSLCPSPSLPSFLPLPPSLPGPRRLSKYTGVGTCGRGREIDYESFLALLCLASVNYSQLNTFSWLIVFSWRYGRRGYLRVCL